jgi:hypothetical protein
MIPSLMQVLHVACFSENELDGKFDGFNVMFLEESGGLRRTQSDGRAFKRLGIGEIVLAGWFDSLAPEEVVLL